MNQIVFAAGVLLFPAVCTTLGAAGVFLLRRSAAPRTQRVLSGMAAGIMLGGQRVEPVGCRPLSAPGS